MRANKSSGGCIITLRDYDKENRDGILLKPHGVREVDGVKHILFQSWEFNGDIYKLSMYCITDRDTDVKTQVFRTKYYAISPYKISSLMRKVGFSSVKIVDCDYFQPLIVGTKINCKNS